MSQNEQPKKEIHITEEQLKNQNCLYVIVNREGKKQDLYSINIQDLEEITVTVDKTIAFNMINNYKE